MEEIEEKINGIKLKETEGGNDEVESDKEETEKVSNRAIKLQKNKNKRDEKKKNKQNTKNKKEKSNQTINNNDNDANDTGKEETVEQTEEKNAKESNGKGYSDNIITDETNTTENKTVILPVQVEYCKICTMPYEYCEYGKFYDECREENKDKYDYGISNVVRDPDSKKKVKRPEKPTDTKITIQKMSRAKKKVVTVVTGLHAYAKLDKMSKIFSKTFACGASVIKGTNNFPDHVDIQGDVGNSIIGVIMKNCPEITEDKFVFLAPK